MAQYTDHTNVRIFTHTHLSLDRSFLDKKMPDIAIIDESFCLSMVNSQHTTFKLIKHYIENKALANIIVNSLVKEQPLLRVLKNKFKKETCAVLKEAANKMFETLPTIKPNMSNDKLSEILNKDLKETINEKNALAILLNNLKTDIENYPKIENTIAVRLVGNEEVEIAHRHSLTRFTKPRSKEDDDDNEEEFVPVLCIDADYYANAFRVFFPDIKCARYRVERNAYVTQIHSATNAKSRFFARRNGKASRDEVEAAKKHIANIQKIIDQCFTDHGKLLVVGYKALMDNVVKGVNKPLLVMPEDCEFVHFGALRGLNTFSDFNAAIIIGRHQLPIEALESQAAALWWDSDLELVLTGNSIFESRGYRDRRNKKLGMKVMVCSDAWAQKLQELQREGETLQALDRLRLMYNKKKKHVYVLSNLPLDITVDKLVSLPVLIKGKTAIKRALLLAQNDVLPINPDYLLKNYSNLFKTLDATKKALQAFNFSARMRKCKTVGVNSYVVINTRRWNLITFSVKGRRAKPINALVDAKMTQGQIKYRLRTIFGAAITVVDSTLKAYGLEHLKPKPSPWDGIEDDFTKNKRCSRYSTYNDGWYEEV